ncbi:MAG: aspartyl/glutamyl-tRNA amidotransferase subunit C [Candidatus Magasanikbacteria bacterium]|nr:aspartyl/glutamyl-tRNA amidotransferase subunit C [Candidatus Magasanikbacteria bacterium]
MRLNTALIEHLAQLARLKLPAAEFSRDLESILRYVEKIQSLKRATAAPDATSANEFLRTDLTTDCPPQEKQNIKRLFPEKEEDLMKVKGVFGNQL